MTQKNAREVSATNIRKMPGKDEIKVTYENGAVIYFGLEYFNRFSDDFEEEGE